VAVDARLAVDRRMHGPTPVLLLVGRVASVVVFVLMRYPSFRRVQFRQYPPFSLWLSLVAAVALLGAFIALALVQR
jgi:hypothetical protein